MLRLMAPPRWAGSIILVQILSLGLPLDAVSWIANALLNARGEFRRSAFYTGVSAALFLSFVYVGERLGAGVGVAIAVSVYYAWQGPTYTKLVFGQAISWRRLVTEVYGPPVAIAAYSMGLAYALSFMPILDGWQIPRAIVIGGVGCGLHGLIYWKLQPAMAREVFRRVGGERLLRVAVGRISRA
jgi:PST family polysaccharide transporter